MKNNNNKMSKKKTLRKDKPISLTVLSHLKEKAGYGEKGYQYLPNKGSINQVKGDCVQTQTIKRGKR